MNVTQSLLIIALLFPLVALSIYAVLKPKRKEPQYPAEPEEQPAERVQLRVKMDPTFRGIAVKMRGSWVEVSSAAALIVGDVIWVEGESNEWRCVRVDYAADELYLEPVK